MTTPLESFRYQKGILHVEGLPITDLVREYGAPLYIYSKSALKKNLGRLQQALPDALICYAIKANSNLSVLSELRSWGAGADIVSGGELYRCLRAGFDPEKILFSGVGKTDLEIETALKCGERGIYSIHVESEFEMRRISRIAQRLDRSARVAFRFNPDVKAETHRYLQTGTESEKFGLGAKEILSIVSRIDDFPRVELHGVSVHIGSMISKPAPLIAGFKKTLSLMKKIESALGRKLSYVSLGGGLAVPYQLKGKEFPLKPYAQAAQKIFAGYAIRLEPGRYIAANAGILVTQVLGVKSRPRGSIWIVDAGMNDLIRPSLYGSFHEIIPVASNRKKRVRADVVGPVCESGDFFALNRTFGFEAREGDFLAILSAGAYGMSMSSQYNTRPRPAEILIEGTSHRLARKRETYEDLVAGEPA